MPPMLLVHLNTYGGAIDAADSIRCHHALRTSDSGFCRCKRSIGFGALIALACDSVYMAPRKTSMGTGHGE